MHDMIKIETVNVKQLVKNKDLSYGLMENEVNKISKIISDYGHILPIIVTETDDKGMYKIIKGQDVFDAAILNKFRKIKVLIIKKTEYNEKLIPLSISRLKYEIGAISQGTLINKLIQEDGFDLGTLSKTFEVSKSWLCKRQSLVNNLNAEVMRLVSEGKIAPRTAEEIAKLPIEFQGRFAGHVIRNSMSKAHTYELVRLYRDQNINDDLRKRIIDDPASVKLIGVGKTRRKKTKKELIPMALDKSLNHAIIALKNVQNQLFKANNEELQPLYDQIQLLAEQANRLNNWSSKVLPKK